MHVENILSRVTLSLLILLVCLNVSTVSAQTDTMVLEIESIDLYETVVSMPTEIVEINGKLFRRPVTPLNEVAWLFTSAVPDVGENIVMFGHDFTVFARLDEVKYGDTVVVYANGVQYKYLITSISIVPDTNISNKERERVGRMLGPQGKEVLTLVTCSGSDRLVVIGDRIYEVP